MDTNTKKDFEEFLRKAKARLTVRIDAYNNSMDVNYFTLDGVRLWLGFGDRQRLRLSIAAYEHDGAKEMTKVWNGKSYTFSIETWEDMLAKVEMYASECQNVTERHLAEVDAMESVDGVLGYDVSKGYPERLTFSSAATGAATGAAAKQWPTEPSEKCGGYEYDNKGLSLA